MKKIFTWLTVFSLILQLGSGVFLYRPAFAEETTPPETPVEEVVEEPAPAEETPEEVSAEPVDEIPTEEPTEEVVEEPAPVEEEPAEEPTLIVEQEVIEEPIVEEEVPEETVAEEETAAEPEPDLEEAEVAEESAELNPSVSTDKEDYAPGETVKITGENFPPDTLLIVKITRPDGSVVKGDGSFEPGSDGVTTDAEGKFEYYYQLNGIEGEYLVEVFLGEAVLATTTFTDTVAAWDKSSLYFESGCSGDCDEIEATVCNGEDSEDMEGTSTWELYWIASGNPKGGSVIASGTINALEAGECQTLSYNPGDNPNGAPGNYMFKAYQRPDHPGTGELWSEACELVCEQEECVEGEAWASGVVNFNQGTRKDGSPVLAERSNPNNALGVPDSPPLVVKFVSLGVNGSIILTFSGWILDVSGNDLSFHETTWGRDGYPEEKAMIEVSQDGSNWQGSWEVTNHDGGDGIGYIDFSSTGLSWIKFVKITDTTNYGPFGGDADGYDLDAVDAINQVCEEPRPVCDPNVELVTNGGFESPIVGTSQKWDIYDSGTAGLGWNVEWYGGSTSYGGQTRPDPAHLELHRGVNGWLPYSGSQHSELDTDWDGPGGGLNNEPASVSIYQDISTIPGEWYTVKFYFSPRPGTAETNNRLQLKWNGVVIDTISASGGGNTLWTEHTYNLQATSSTTRLELTDVGTPDSLGTFLDDVSLRCGIFQPEPECGNGQIETGEVCDDGENNGQYGYCNADCTGPGPYCGDGTKNGPEECDGEDGVLENYICTESCTLEYVPYCGDGEINQPEEECDGEAGVTPGENFCTYQCQLVPIYDGEHSCPAGTVKSDNPVASYSIFGNDINGETFALTVGGKYLFEASGTFRPTSPAGWWADAGYTTNNDWSSLATQYGIHGTGNDYAAHALLADLGSGVGVVDWGNYNPDHVYAKYYEPTTSPVQFVIGDRYDNWFNTPQWNNNSGMSDNSGSLSLNVYECQLPPVTIKAYKIVCSSEADLPNWSGGASTDANTASNFVASHPNCHLESGWDFQWGFDDKSGQQGVDKLNGPHIGLADGTPSTGLCSAPYCGPNTQTGSVYNQWKTFGPTDGNGEAVAVINDLEGASNIWVRESLKENYVPFTYPPQSSPGSNVSAEIWCHTDVLNYDNYDRIQGVQYGQTYYCVAFNALNYGSISGVKFRDLNGNGANDGEPNLSGWKMVLTGTSAFSSFNVPATGETVNSASLDSGKKYLVKVSGTAQAGDNIHFDAECASDGGGTPWINGVPRYLSYGENLLDLKVNGGFVNWGSCEPVNHTYYYLLTGTGSPASFNIYDIYYPNNTGGLSVEIYEVIKEDTTDGSGYGWTDVFPGDYQLCEIIQSGWNQTKPGSIGAPACYSFTVTPGSNNTYDFGNFLFGLISGHKFNDRNGNGNEIPDVGEEWLSDWTFELQKWNGESWETVATDITDGGGNWSFGNLKPGTYRVIEILKPGWIATTFISGYGPLANPGAIANVNFGNFQLGKITACKYDDYDGDQGKDEPIAGVTINLYGEEECEGECLAINGGPVDSCETDETGCCTFEGLYLGDYTVAEDTEDPDLAGYEPTSPTSVPVALDTSGQEETVDFFNELQPIELSLEKTHDKVGTTASPGDTFNFTLTVENTAESTAYDVIVRDVLPDGFSYVAGTASPSEPTVSGQQLIWSLDDMASGDIVIITYQVTTDSSLPAGEYPNDAVAKGTNRPAGSDDNATSYSNFAIVYTTLGVGVSYAYSVGGAVLGAAIGPEILGAATGSPTILLILALLMILAGIALMNLETIKKRLAKFNYKKLMKGLLLTLVILVFSSSVVSAADSLIISIGKLPDYISYDPFKIYYTALQVEGKPVEVKAFMNKDGQSKFEFGTSNQTSGSFTVDGSLLTGDGKYYFLVKATSDGVTVQSAEESVILDRSAPAPVSGYRKEKIGSKKYKICWKNPDEDDFKEVLIYRSDETEFEANHTTQVAAIGGSKNDEKCWENDVPEDKEYYYVIRVIDKAGNISGVVGDPETTVTTTEEALGVVASPTPLVLPVVSPAPTGEIEEGQILGGETVEETPAPEVLGGLGQTVSETVSGLGVWKTLGLGVVGAGIIALIIYFFKRS